MVRTISLAVLSVLLGSAWAMPAAAATACGGSGGSKVQTFTCGPGELVTSLVAYGGSYVNQVIVQCSRIQGELADATSSLGKKSATLGGKPATGSSAFALCPDGTAVWNIDSYCGIYVDRLVSITCGQVKSTDGVRTLTRAVNLRYLNVGGPDGQRKNLTCPTGKGIYKVTVRSGDWIDRIDIACRAP